MRNGDNHWSTLVAPPQYLKRQIEYIFLMPTLSTNLKIKSMPFLIITFAIAAIFFAFSQNAKMHETLLETNLF